MYPIKLFVQDPLTGAMAPYNLHLDVPGPSVDAAMKQVAALLSQKKLPPIRSMNMGPKNTIVVYCAHPVIMPELAPNMADLEFKKPTKLSQKK